MAINSPKPSAKNHQQPIKPTLLGTVAVEQLDLQATSEKADARPEEAVPTFDFVSHSNWCGCLVDKGWLYCRLLWGFQVVCSLA
jgi:hypothetical protein